MKRAGALLCSIGSTDPTGAAGLTMDVRVYAQLRAPSAGVIVAVTAQNQKEVVAVHNIAPDVIDQQLRAVWEQERPKAVCIGLVPSIQALQVVRRFLKKLRPRPAIVVDPVIAATSGYRFLGAPQLRELRKLLPLVTVVTPNAFEASVLSKLPVNTIAQAEIAARVINKYGCAALVTGGHLSGSRCIDVLAYKGRVQRYATPRLRGTMRGSGGILAAALALELSRDSTLEQAVKRAREFVARTRRRAG